MSSDTQRTWAGVGPQSSPTSEPLQTWQAPVEPAARAQSPSPARWLALDVFRALAVLWMIQGHTFTALLGKDFGGGFGRLYRMLHGLTAPMFLCGAGLSYGIVIFNERRPAPPGRMLRRALLLLLIGTLLQLPSTSLLAILRRRDYLVTVTQPGPLQLVAACLVLAELLRLSTGGHHRLRFARAATLLGLGIALLAPWVWTARLSAQHVLGGWLDGQAGAQFPFVPWVCFFLMGAVLSGLWGSRLWLDRWRAPALGGLGLVLSGLCYWQYLEGERLNGLYGEHLFWHSNPMFIAFRGGLVLAWLGVLSAASGGIAHVFALLPSFGRLIAGLSRHSLVAYVVHLIVLYGSPISRGLRRLRPHYDLLECSLACAFVLLVSIWVVLNWERLRAAVGAVLRLLRRLMLSLPAVVSRSDSAD